MKTIITKNNTETKEFAKNFAKELLSEKEERSGALVVALEGVLGAGKTTFSQGFASGLGVKEEVTSPTFVILKEYNFHKHKIKESGFENFYHIDCYRLEDEDDIESIGLPEILKDSKNIVLIEWAGKIKNALPKDLIKVKFYYISENKRKIVVN